MTNMGFNRLTDFGFSATPQCSFCGSARAEGYIAGSRALMCLSCARRTAVATPVHQDARCDFCSRAIGSRHGLLWRRVVTVALLGDGVVCCTECLDLARGIADEQEAAA